MITQTRYMPLPLIATNKLTGETCRLAYVSIGDERCDEGSILLEHVTGPETTWETLSTAHYAMYHSREWKIRPMNETAKGVIDMTEEK